MAGLGHASCAWGPWGQTISELPWLPVGVTYLPLPLGSLVTLLFVLEHIVFGSQHQRADRALRPEADEARRRGGAN